jgi:CysZ protein
MPPLPLAHGSWVELIAWLAWQAALVAAWLVIVAALSLAFALAVGSASMLILRRGRFVLPLTGLTTIAAFALINPGPRLAEWTGQPVFGMSIVSAAAWIVAGLCGLIAAAFLAGAGRMVQKRGEARLAGIAQSAPARVTLQVMTPYVAQSKSADLREGLQAPLEGLRYLLAHRELWRYALLPILLNLLITGFVLLLLFGIGAWFAAELHPEFARTWWGTLLEILSGVAILVVALALAAITWLALNGILCGHFYAKLAKRVELQLGTPPERLRDVPLRQQVIDTLRDLASLLVINAGLLLLNIVPAIGSIVALVLGFYFDGFLFGADYLDYPMSLRGMRRRAKRDLCKAHRWQTIGLGGGVFAFNLVPVIGAILGAAAVVGAVLLFHRWPAKATADAASDRARAFPSQPVAVPVTAPIA